MNGKIDILSKNEKPIHFTISFCCANCGNCKTRIIQSNFAPGGIPDDDMTPEMVYYCKLYLVDAGEESMSYYKTISGGFCPRHTEYKNFKKNTNGLF